jgi:hypothetical protein
MTTQYITIKKISDHGGAEKTPTHAIVMKEGKDGQEVTIGKLWTKTGTYGKFLAGSINEDYTSKEGKEYKGFKIIQNQGKEEVIENIEDDLDIPF